MSNISHKYQEYLVARSALEEAVRDLAAVTQAAGMFQDRVAQDILDVAYDCSPGIYKEMQKSCLPFVAKFKGSESIETETVLTDWEKIIDKWEKNNMWEILRS